MSKLYFEGLRWFGANAVRVKICTSRERFCFLIVVGGRAVIRLSEVAD
jgi:hypothetical protein